MGIPHENVAIRWIAGHDKQAKGYAVFFDGDTIFSWGRHYAIARFIDTPKGRVCLFNSEGYSVSTAKHKTVVARQLRRWRPDMPVFYVPFVKYAESMHSGNLAALAARESEARDKAKRARVNRDYWLGVAGDLLAAQWDYAAAFGMADSATKAA